MEKRRFYRKTISLEAKLILGSKKYAGFINNMSEDGIFIITTPRMTAIDFTNGKKLELKFRPLLRKTLCLKCKVKWSYKTPPLGLTNSIGLEITDNAPEYEEFLKTMQ